MLNRRTSGVLLHPTSLPGRFGIGELGNEARDFVDFLAQTRQALWQVLPLGPTGYGDSPYQCFSAFGGNPLLVSLERLVADGLLSPSDLALVPEWPEGEVDFGSVIAFKKPLLRKAGLAFSDKAKRGQQDAFIGFCRDKAAWLDDFALFMALKERHGGVAWNRWDRELVVRDPAALERARIELARELHVERVIQYLFFSQWAELRAHAHGHGIQIMGDIPIFVAHDSADVWAHPGLFHLAADGSPSFQAGVPPDYFSATGQLWGNPLYRWDVMARDGYRWWVERFRTLLESVDIVRLDHFRGFEAAWEIPGGETTAIKGRWANGPGAAFFETLGQALGSLPIVAENLGVITPQVEELRQRFGFPGMAILQFAFGDDSQASDFLPHRFPRNVVVYTGTHDNDTIVGWWNAGVGESTRTEGQVERERDFCRRYLNTDGTDIHWAFIRQVLASVANTALFPLQDVLGVGASGRMNVPGRMGGNWKWRFAASDLTPQVRNRLATLTQTYGRALPKGH
jgi:4-alpha-glucanotransferase